MPRIIELSTGGSLTFAGPITFKSIDVAGSLTIDGSAEGDELTVSGSARISGKTDVSTLSIKGSMKVGDSLNYGHCEILGSMAVTNSVVGKVLDVSGNLKAGTIESLEITVLGKIVSRSITANEIRIGKSSRVSGPIVCNKASIGKEAEIEEIYCRDVVVEKGSECGTVECQRIRVERDSEIDELRYVESAEVDPRADVGRMSKIDSLTRRVPDDFMKTLTIKG